MFSNFAFYKTEDKLLIILFLIIMLLISIILYVIEQKYKEKINKSNNKLIKLIFCDRNKASKWKISVFYKELV